MKQLAKCSRLATCRSQPGGLPEVSRGLRRTAKRSDDTPGNRAEVHDLERVEEVLASLQDAIFRDANRGCHPLGRVQPPANVCHRSAMELET